MIRVGVIGAAGRMGREVVAAVTAAADLELGALVDPSLPADGSGVPVVGSIDLLPDGLVDVIVDFTIADSARQHLAPALRRGIHAVVGTTGLNEADLAEIARASDEGGGNCLVAPNFALGAVLAMQFARQAARFFKGVEIIELHHDAKIDAPSGTALSTARAIAEARSDAGAGEPVDPTTTLVLEGSRGGKGAGGISIHSVRLPGLVAHEEILFGNPGEGLSIRHDSFDRSSFMGGVVLAVRQISDRPGLTLGLEPLLSL